MDRLKVLESHKTKMDAKVLIWHSNHAGHVIKFTLAHVSAGKRLKVYTCLTCREHMVISIHFTQAMLGATLSTRRTASPVAL